MSPRLAWSLFGLHLIALLVGTQKPNAWRNRVDQSLNVFFPLYFWKHFAVFFGMSLLLALTLALLTEAL